jgi:alpha-beta hydrolase superfamily lysophospholipase
MIAAGSPVPTVKCAAWLLSKLQESAMPELKCAGTQTIHYEVYGEGPVILMLHGFLCDSGLFIHQTKALQTEGYKVITIDLRGHGR